jgi:hypothetical protein
MRSSNFRKHAAVATQLGTGAGVGQRNHEGSGGEKSHRDVADRPSVAAWMYLSLKFSCCRRNRGAFKSHGMPGWACA